MKWHSHKVVGFGASLLFGFHPIQILITTVSSVVPDTIELGVLTHRGISHAWYFYLMLFIAGYFLIHIEFFSIYAPYLLIGIGMHLVCDALTPMGVPLVPFGKARLALGVCRTGSVIEYILVYTFLIVSTATWLSRAGIIFLQR